MLKFHVLCDVGAGKRNPDYVVKFHQTGKKLHASFCVRHQVLFSVVPWSHQLCHPQRLAAAIANVITSDVTVAQMEPSLLVPKNSMEHGIIGDFF